MPSQRERERFGTVGWVIVPYMRAFDGANIVLGLTFVPDYVGNRMGMRFANILTSGPFCL